MPVTITRSNYIKSISDEGIILVKWKKQEKTGCEEGSNFFEATILKNSNFDENWNGFFTPKKANQCFFSSINWPITRQGFVWEVITKKELEKTVFWRS